MEHCQHLLAPHRPSQSPSAPCFPKVATFWLLTPEISLPVFEMHINRITISVSVSLYLAFKIQRCLCGLSSLLCVAVVHLPYGVALHGMSTPRYQFIHLTADRHVAWFQFWPIVNNTAVSFDAYQSAFLLLHT